MREKEARVKAELQQKQENAEFERLIREQKKTDSFQRKLLETQQFLARQAENERKIEVKQRALQESRKEQAEERERQRREKIESIASKLDEIHEEKEARARERDVLRTEKVRLENRPGFYYRFRRRGR